jgi:hypothetical protein
MERQYTFQFELFGRKPIEYKGVKVSDYKDVTQVEPLRLTWAGSNIYWDGSKLTFDDDSIKTNEEYQGVYFKWGSLIGMSPAGNNASTWSGITYVPTNPGVDDTWTIDNTKYSTTNLGYGKIPYVDDVSVGSYVRADGNAHLTDITINHPDTVKAFKGDICVYLTNTGAAPKGKRWRMPTSKEFGEAANYDKIGSFPTVAIVSPNADGTNKITNGWQRTDLNHPYFPASGNRSNTVGSLYNVSITGNYWSSSPADVLNGFGFSTNNTAVNPANLSNKTAGLPIRCVAY